jgi:SAM-dependent methyltransferase
MPKTRRTARRAEFLASASRGDAELGRALRDALAQDSATERYTHLFHTYPAALHADAARDLLALFPGASVLDPFCGGGTVLVEARAAGRRALGCDVSPIAVRVARARCAAPDEATLSALRSRRASFAARALRARADRFRTSRSCARSRPGTPSTRCASWRACAGESPSPTLRCAACSRRSSPRSS